LLEVPLVVQRATASRRSCDARLASVTPGTVDRRDRVAIQAPQISEVYIEHRREHREAAAGRAEDECRSPAQQVAARADMKRDVHTRLFIACECACVRAVHVRAGGQGWELEIVSTDLDKEQPKCPFGVPGTRAEFCDSRYCKPPGKKMSGA
jgi:hypothetical protein